MEFEKQWYEPLGNWNNRLVMKQELAFMCQDRQFIPRGLVIWQDDKETAGVWRIGVRTRVWPIGDTASIGKLPGSLQEKGASGRVSCVLAHDLGAFVLEKRRQFAENEAFCEWKE